MDYMDSDDTNERADSWVTLHEDEYEEGDGPTIEELPPSDEDV
jgi:hypothetical protein